MAASRVALKRLSSLILSGSPRTVTLPVASRFSSSGSLRPGTLQAASRSISTNVDIPFHDPFYAFPNTSLPATMAAPRVARKRLSSLILSGPVASRFCSSGSLCPGALQAASRSFSTDADKPPYDPFYAICGTSESQSFPPLHHEYMVQNLRDGFHICMYMIGVGKGDVKLWMESGELIAEGIKEKDFEHEDGTKTQFIYRMLGPPNEVYDHSAIKAEINNGLLRVFLPRRDQNMFIPREC